MSEHTLNGQTPEPEGTGAEVFDITTKRPASPAPHSVPEPAETAVSAAQAPSEADDDEDESPRLRPVDSPDLPAPGITNYKRLPILPSWLTSKPGFVSTAQRAASNAFYSTVFHGIRTPWYALQLGLNAPRGAARLVRDTNRWMWDAEAAPLRAYEVLQENTAEYLKLSRQRDGRVRLRVLVTTVGARLRRRVRADPVRHGPGLAGGPGRRLRCWSPGSGGSPRTSP